MPASRLPISRSASQYNSPWLTSIQLSINLTQFKYFSCHVGMVGNKDFLIIMLRDLYEFPKDIFYWIYNISGFSGTCIIMEIQSKIYDHSSSHYGFYERAKIDPHPILPPNQTQIWGKGLFELCKKRCFHLIKCFSSPKFLVLEFGGGREGSKCRLKDTQSR